MVKNVYGYSSLVTQKLALSQEGINVINFFWYVDTNSRKLKVTLIIFGWQSKIGLAFEVKNKLMKWWSDFLYADTSFGKLKVTLVIIGGGHGQKWARPCRSQDS